MINLSRDSSGSEKFARFLTRLERLAKIVSEETVVQTFLVNKHFQRALTPSIRSFLREREKNTESPAKIAAFLDGLGKHKQTPELNSLESFKTHEEIQQLHAKFDSLQEEMREILHHQRPKNVNFDPNLAIMNVIKAKSQKGRPGFPFDNSTFPPHWEINRYGRPFRCRKCGLRGHRDENCRGTTLTCRLCNTVGHIQLACPQREQKSYQKN